MSSLDKRYINHLRQRAKDASSLDGYVCPRCKHRNFFQDSKSFMRHFDESHGEEAEELVKDPAFDFRIWREQIENQARNAGRSTRNQPQDVETTSSGGFGIGGLSLDPKNRVSPPKMEHSRDRERPDADPGGRKRRNSSDGQQGNFPQSRTTSRNPRKVAHSNNDQRATPDPTPPQRNPTLHFNDEGELVSRQLWNPQSASASQVTSTSRAAQPASSTAAGSGSYIRHQAGGPSPGSVAPTSSSNMTGPESWPPRQQQPVGLGPNLGSGGHHYAPQRHNERGVLQVSSEVMAQQSVRERGVIAMPTDPRFPDMLMQPDSRPISQEQLSAEVKAIYAGLVMVESKCIHVDKAQASAIRGAERGETKIADDHWQALIALHRTLLHEHHDFFLASQHPSASPALRRLATKYTMPARMWKHGIHSFLELLRYRLPDSLEFMISFIYTAYQMMSLLYETVPAFEDTWIECLGDLGRYRMAIEDEDIRDRETWAGVARFWYSKAADRSPEVGRLYHHLAILARPNGLQQLYLYSRSLTSVQIFHSARESILTLFNPLMGRSESSSSSSQLSKIDTFFIKTHAVIFSKDQQNDIEPLRTGFLDLLDPHIGRVTAKWREQGAYVIIANLGALFDFGTTSHLRRIFELGYSNNPSSPTTTDPKASPAPLSTLDPTSQSFFALSLELTIQTTTIVLRRIGDKNVLPYVHILLSFLTSLASIQQFDPLVDESRIYVARSIFQAMPWTELCAFINTLARTESIDPRYESLDFIRPEKGDARPLPEDHLIRGQVWSQKLFPSDWFKESEVDDEERSIEHASTVRVRAERVLWLTYRLAHFNQWIRYDPASRSWSAIEKFPHFEDDVVMTDVSNRSLDDPGYISEEDSPEMKALNKEARGQASSLIRPEGEQFLAVPESGPPLHAADAMLQPNYTTMVCDEEFLLKDQDSFELLIKCHYSIVIPQQVFASLTRTNSLDAQKAVRSVRDAFSKKKDVRIMTTSGVDMTQKSLNKSPSSSPQTTAEEFADPKENLVRVARQATFPSKDDGNATASSNEFRPAILLTEDKPTRLAAAREKVAAITPSMLKRILSARPRRRSSAAKSRSKDSGMDTKWTSDPDRMQI